jgi:hypothetical protein
VNGLDVPPDFDLDEATPVLGVRDLSGLAEVATRGVKHVEAHPGAPVPGLCAVYVHALAELRPFETGLNYRAAMRTLRFTARLNRWEDSLTDEDWRRLLGDLARGDMTEEQLAAFVAALMRPRWRAT